MPSTGLGSSAEAGSADSVASAPSATAGEAVDETKLELKAAEAAASATAGEDKTGLELMPAASADMAGKLRSEARLQRMGFEVEDQPPETVFQQLKQLKEKLAVTALNRCRKCKNELKDLKVQCKGKSTPCMVCDYCNRGSVMLARHATWPCPKWCQLSEEQHALFFQEVVEIQKDPTTGSDKGLTWPSLRELLKKFLCRRMHSIQETEAAQGGEFLPLSVYKTQGYDTEKIKANCPPQDKEEHPVLGLTYRLSIKSLRYRDIDRCIEEHINKLESDKKAANQEKRNAKNGRGALHDDTESPAEESRELSEKELEKLRKKEAGQQAAELKKRERDQEKEKAKLLKDLATHNSSVVSLATRSRAALFKAEQKASQVLKNPKVDQMPACFVQKLQTSYEQVALFRSQCDSALAGAKKAAEKGVKLEALSFNKNGVAELIKDIDDSTGALTKMLTLLPLQG